MASKRFFQTFVFQVKDFFPSLFLLSFCPLKSDSKEIQGLGESQNLPTKWKEPKSWSHDIKGQFTRRTPQSKLVLGKLFGQTMMFQG